MNDAAKAVGVSKSTWQKWEEGSPPNAVDAVKAANLLGVSAHDLWGAPCDATSAEFEEPQGSDGPRVDRDPAFSQLPSTESP